MSSIGPLVAPEPTGSENSASNRKDYNLAILRCIQLMFANLLGSQLQFYHPKKFWKQFRSVARRRQ